MTAWKPVTVTDNRGDHVFGRLRDLSVETFDGREEQKESTAKSKISRRTVPINVEFSVYLQNARTHHSSRVI